MCLSLAADRRDVCFWPKADILIAWANVRYSGVKQTSKFDRAMSACDAVDGALSAASKCLVALEARAGQATANVEAGALKELARTRRRNANKVDPGIGRTRLGHRTLKCALTIGTRSWSGSKCVRHARHSGRQAEFCDVRPYQADAAAPFRETYVVQNLAAKSALATATGNRSGGRRIVPQPAGSAASTSRRERKFVAFIARASVQ